MTSASQFLRGTQCDANAIQTCRNVNEFGTIRHYHHYSLVLANTRPWLMQHIALSKAVQLYIVPSGGRLNLGRRNTMIHARKQV
jgi:hypothetical protein